MCAVVMFDDEKVMKIFWSVGGGVPKTIRNGKSVVTRCDVTDSDSARRVQLIDMSEGGCPTRGRPFLSNPTGTSTHRPRDHPLVGVAGRTADRDGGGCPPFGSARVQSPLSNR